MTFGEQLREVRLLRGLTYKQLAELTGVSAGYLNQLEFDKIKTPSPRILFAIAIALGADYEKLMQLANYPVQLAVVTGRHGGSLIARALDTEKITDTEAVALARYLRWYREERSNGLPTNEVEKQS